MHRSLPLLLGCALSSVLWSQAGLADDSRIHAKFSFANPTATEMAFQRDLDVCVRKAGTVSFEDGAPNTRSSAGLGRVITTKNSPPNPQRFLACMQDKAYRLDPDGRYRTGWITFVAGRQDT